MAGILIYLLFLLLHKPNVTGYFVTAQYYGYAACDGAFSSGGYSSRTYQVGENGGLKYNLDASRSNSIYADNGSIYPRSLVLNYIIKS